jgi:hypothetical protein
MALKARAARPISAGPSATITPNPGEAGSRPNCSAAAAKPARGAARRRAKIQPSGATMARDRANHISTRRCQLLGKASGWGRRVTHWSGPTRRAATKSPSMNGGGARPNRLRVTGAGRGRPLALSGAGLGDAGRGAGRATWGAAWTGSVTGAVRRQGLGRRRAASGSARARRRRRRGPAAVARRGGAAQRVGQGHRPRTERRGEQRVGRAAGLARRTTSS